MKRICSSCCWSSRWVPAAIVLYRNYNARLPTDSVSGNIELEQVNIAFKTAGRLIERTVDEGDNVTKGQVIARLDRDQLMQQRERETAALVRSASATCRRRRPRRDGRHETSAADLEARKADLRYQRGAAGGAEERLASAGESRKPRRPWPPRKPNSTAPRRIGIARRTLHKNDDISTSQFDQSQSRFESAEATLKQAKEREALVKAGPRTEDIDAGASAGGAARAPALKAARRISSK